MNAQWKRETRQVFLISALSGFFLAALGYPCWQHAVEGAQVAAQTVRYPGGESPFGIYQLHVWTLLHQIPAFFLSLGVSEKILSIALSGLQGMLSFSALSLGLFLFCRDRLFSCLLPFLIFYSKAYFFGLNYPVFLMGVTSTYGTVALFTFFLSVVLFCADRYRSSGFLLGLLISIHPAFALMSLSMTLPVLLLLKVTEKRFWIFFMAGLFASLLSFLFHVANDGFGLEQGFSLLFHPPKSLPEFIRLWDSHRQPIPLKSEGTVLAVLSMLISAVWLTRYRSDLDRNSKTLLSIFFAFNLAAAGGVLFSHIPPARLPSWLLTLMPARLTSLVIPAYLIMVFGLLHRFRENKTAVWSELLLIGLLFFQRKVFILLVFAAVVLFICRLLEEKKRMTFFSPNISIFLRTALLLPLFLLGFYYMAWEAAAQGRANLFLLKDRTNDSFYAQASRGSGYLLLGPGVSGMQLLTRRPVLLDPDTLDLIPYVPQAAESMGNILKEVYGVSLFGEKAKGSGQAILPPEDTRELWHRYSAADWKRIRTQYTVTEVMVPADWTLSLQETAANGDYRLYALPA